MTLAEALINIYAFSVLVLAAISLVAWLVVLPTVGLLYCFGCLA